MLPDQRPLLPRATSPRALAALAAAAVALYVVASSIAMTVQAYSPLPYFDSWGFFDPTAYNWAFLFAQHNEHRLVVPGLLFLAGLLVDRGTNVLLLVLNYLCIATTAALLLFHLPHRARSDMLLVGALVVALLFSAMQYTNLVWGFQIQFFIVQTLAIGAIIAASATRRPSLAVAGTVAAIVLAVMATFSLASGLLVWPVIVLVAARLTPRRWIPLVLACAGAITVFTYFANFDFGTMKYATWDPVKMLVFWLAYLGGPAGTLVSGPLARFLHVYVPAETLSVVAGVAVILLTIRLIARATLNDASRADIVLAAVALYGVLTAAATAHGRAAMPLVEAISPRYTTPPLVLFAVLAIGAMRRTWSAEPQRLSRRFVIAALVGLVLLALHQPEKLMWSAIDHQRYQRARTAIEIGVFDPDAWKILYPYPRDIVSIADMLRRRRLSVFASDAKWVDSIGSPITAIAPVRTTECAGNMDFLGPVEHGTDGAYTAMGWSSMIDGATPERIALVGEDGRIEGFGGLGFPRPDLSAARPELAGASGWVAYVRAGSAARTLTAYAVRSGKRCALSSPRPRPERRSGR